MSPSRFFRSTGTSTRTDLHQYDFQSGWEHKENQSHISCGKFPFILQHYYWTRYIQGLRGSLVHALPYHEIPKWEGVVKGDYEVPRKCSQYILIIKRVTITNNPLSRLCNHMLTFWTWKSRKEYLEDILVPTGHLKEIQTLKFLNYKARLILNRGRQGWVYLNSLEKYGFIRLESLKYVRNRYRYHQSPPFHKHQYQTCSTKATREKIREVLLTRN